MFDQSKSRLDQRLTDIANIEMRVKQIEKSASRKATFLMGLGSSVVLGQFGIIFYGTFHVLSWDIMEPVCYLMTLGNFTFGYLYYLLQKKDMEYSNLHELMTLRFTASACAREGICLDELEKMKEEAEQIREELKLIL